MTAEVRKPSKLKTGITKVVRKTSSRRYNKMRWFIGIKTSGRNRIRMENMSVGIKRGCRIIDMVLAIILVTIILF
jgi:hypothetical protein